MRRESPDELTRLVVTALAVFIGGTAALVANDTIRAYRLEIAAKQAVIELNKELARQDKAAAQAEAARQAKQAAQKKAQEQAQEQVRQAQIQQKIAQDRARQEALRQHRIKTEAFENFYKPTPACRADSAQGPCADAYLRARNAFEKEWAKTH